jgi:hypothetical protein
MNTLQETIELMTEEIRGLEVQVCELQITVDNLKTALLLEKAAHARVRALAEQTGIKL